MSTLLTLTPFDTLFFRDGRAFDAADGTDAQSIFPPMPQTLQGMVRSRLLADHCGRWVAFAKACQAAGGPCEHLPTCKVREVVGQVGTSGTIRFRGPWIQVGDEFVLPAPADLVALDRDRKELEQGATASLPTAILTPQPTRSPTCNHPGALVPLVPPASFEAEDFGVVDGWLTWEAVKTYLGGIPPELIPGQNWWRSGDLWSVERRPGLTIQDRRNAAAEGFLYFASHTRLEAGFAGPVVRLTLEVDGNGGLLKAPVFASPLGGERRAVGVEVTNSPGVPWATYPDMRVAAATAEGLKLVLLQPTWLANGYFGHGWTIGTENASNARATIGTHSFTWISALVGRGDRVGGWNLATQAEKPARVFVPRGSVFYFKTTAGVRVADAVRDLWRTSLSDTPSNEAPDFPSIGLGEALPGLWSRP